MGHSASIARKYQAPVPRVEEEEDRGDTDSLATISSFRPTSPDAHSDAHEFILQPAHTPRLLKAQSHYGYPMQGPMPVMYRTGSLGSRMHGPYSSASLGTTPGRSMHEVHHFLVKNPELLAGKHGKNGYKKKQFHDLGGKEKQIKTKQNVYLGLLDPPVVYGYGVDREREKQLKIKQRVYLQLVAPTVNNIEYYVPTYRSQMPLRREEMVVVRKDDSLKKLAPARSREPLPAIKGKQNVEVPKKSSLRHPPQDMSMQVRREPSRIPNGSVHGLSNLSSVLQTSSPQGAIPKHRGNEYVDMQTPGLLKSATKVQKQKKKEVPQSQQMDVERRFKSDSIGKRHAKEVDSEDEVVFTYDINELGLKKRSEAHSERASNRGKVLPTHLRKSLAYNPNHHSRREVLSGPL